MDYIPVEDVEIYAKDLELYGMQSQIIERLRKKDFSNAVSMCSEAKMRCFQMSRTETGPAAEAHAANLNRITELENMVERLERQQ